MYNLKTSMIRPFGTNFVSIFIDYEMGALNSGVFISSKTIYFIFDGTVKSSEDRIFQRVKCLL